jgi:hypothetical protein
MDDHSKSEKKLNKKMDQALMAEMNIDKEELKKLKKKLQKAEGKPDRGVETWFRLASKNLHTRLQIVDTKANILITSNSIIISVVLGSLYPRLAEDWHLVYAVGGMIITNVLSITFAILATLPQTQRSAEENLGMEKNDLMTFDGFYHMKEEDYKSSVMAILENSQTLYPSILTDIFQLGVKLSRKYRLIRISYLIFLYGIILSVLAFGMCHFLY